MQDETRYKIMHAAMELLKNRGYASMTTKDIAREAGVNECTIFRKFPGKKDIILAAMNEDEWRPRLEDAFDEPVWELEADLMMYASRYLAQVTHDMVRLSIGLRAPQLYDATEEKIQRIPQALLDAVRGYLAEMHRRGRVREDDFDALALDFTAMTFGFAFLKASFGERLSPVGQEDYIRTSVRAFIAGIRAE